VVLTAVRASAQPLIERHSAIYDSEHGTMVVFGGFDGTNERDETWLTSIDDPLRWSVLSPAGTRPTARFNHSAVYDAQTHRMIVFGGVAQGSVTNETWTLSLDGSPAWSQSTAPGITPRRGHAAALDSLRNRMVVFGGRDAGSLLLNDVWSLSLTDMAWTALVPHGTPPPKREACSAIADPVRDRLLVFSGAATIASNDVWTLDWSDTTWRLLAVAGTKPSARSGHTAIYDPVRDRMIVFGGSDATTFLNEIWVLSLSGTPTWTHLVPAGDPPSPRAFHSAVYDATHDAMVVYGGLPYDGQTWTLTLGTTPAWSPSRPVLTVSSDHLILPAVTIGDTVSTTIDVSNMGLASLEITNFELPSIEFQPSVQPPVSLPWLGQVAQTLVLEARAPRVVEDSLIIVSNDPLVPRKRVTISALVHGLDFNSRALGDSVAPLGVALSIVVTPEPGVRIERGTLYYRVAGATSFDSVPLLPLSSDFIATIPAEAVTEQGIEYFIEVENSGFKAARPANAHLGSPPESLLVQRVAAPTAILAVPRPTSGADFLVGRDVEVEALLPAGAVFASGVLHYRQSGETTFADATLEANVLGRPIATIPASAVTARGAEYWMDVHTATSALRFPSAAGSVAPLRAKTLDLVEPLEHAAAQYRMLSVPLDFGVDFTGAIDAMLTDQLGTYDPTRWRMFRYDPAAHQNVELSPAATNAFRPVPGRAFWLISRDAHRIDTNPVPGFSTPTDSMARLVLEPGWNQIGDPFDFPIAWSDVVRDAASVDDPVAFTNGAYAVDPPARLEPFEGYFVENLAAQQETLWVPPRAAAGATTLASRAASGGWRLRLAASAAGAADASNEFGVAPNAAEAFDALDLRKAPSAPGATVRLAFANPGWSVRPGAYRRDVRDASAAGHVWDVEVTSERAGEEVTVELLGDAAPPADLAIGLIDREQGAVQTLLPTPASARGAATGVLGRYTLLSLGPSRPYRLAIVAGTPQFVAEAGEEQRIGAVELTLHPCEPNPFRAATRIRFALPRAERVTAEVFDVRGTRIATLLDGAPLEPGQHALVWSGRAASGGAVASGIYLLRLAAGDRVRTVRLVRIR